MRFKKENLQFGAHFYSSIVDSIYSNSNTKQITH